MIQRTLDAWLHLAAIRCAIAVVPREPRPHSRLVPMGVHTDVRKVPLLWAAASSSTLHILLLVAAIVCAATVVGLLRRRPVSRVRPVAIVAFQYQFRLFEYLCPNCDSKRSIQYFCKDGVFLPQEPRAVCGCCNTSVLVEPFKTVDFSCPCCKKLQKARLPARPVPLNTYNISKVHCVCGFRGEASVGQLIDASCTQCSTPKRGLHHTWSVDDGAATTYCENCREYRTCSTKSAKRTRSEHNDAIVYACKGCSRNQSIKLEDLLCSEGLACCSLCSWVGYPEALFRSSGKVRGACN